MEVTTRDKSFLLNKQEGFFLRDRLIIAPITLSAARQPEIFLGFTVVQGRPP